MTTALERLKYIENVFPDFYNFAVSICNGLGVQDGVYYSTKNHRVSSYFNYFEVKDNRIVAIGHERGREGGWLWFDND